MGFSPGTKGEGVTGFLRCGHDDRSHREETCAIPNSVSHIPKAFLKLGALRYIYTTHTIPPISHSVIAAASCFPFLCTSLHLCAIFFLGTVTIGHLYFFFGNTR